MLLMGWVGMGRSIRSRLLFSRIVQHGWWYLHWNGEQIGALQRLHGRKHWRRKILAFNIP
jgi:hypothetical protein